jgi:hypothetical protein
MCKNIFVNIAKTRIFLMSRVARLSVFVPLWLAAANLF